MTGEGGALRTSCDVEVIGVGYGPVGATAANLLGALGVRATFFTRDEDVCAFPRAIHFDSEVMRVFQNVGLSDRVAATTESIEGVVFRSASGGVLLELRAGGLEMMNGFPNANVFHQPELERILRTGALRFGHVAVQHAHEITSFEQDTEYVTVTARDVKTGELRAVRGRYLLACDGARSTIRELAGIAMRDLGFEQAWLVVDALRRRGPAVARQPQQICDPARPATVVPGVGAHCRWEFMVLPGERSEDLVSPASLARLLSPWVKPEDVEVIRASVYTFRSAVARSWRSKRIFLLGDAAHQMPPFLGQGMCAGIRDAHNLCWKLTLVLRGKATPALLDSYEHERKPHVERVIALSVRAGRIIQMTDPTGAFLRDRLFEIAQRWPRLRKRLERVRVPVLRRGVLFHARRTSRSPAGALFVQPRVRRRDGTVVLLDDVLGSGFAVLRFDGGFGSAWGVEEKEFLRELGAAIVRVLPYGGDGRPSEGSAEPTATEVEDIDGAIEGWFARHRCEAVIVRPDRYVYCGVSMRDLGAAVRNLAAVLGRRSERTLV